VTGIEVSMGRATNATGYWHTVNAAIIIQVFTINRAAATTEINKNRNNNNNYVNLTIGINRSKNVTCKLNKSNGYRYI